MKMLMHAAGPFVYAHTNLTEISQTMDLLWRNNISPSKVTMGLGFYGRSFTLSDPSCTAPGCGFSAGGDPGPCTASAGTLSYAEIQDILNSGKATVTLDPVAAVQIAVWDSNQWVSFDDEQTLKMKVDFANSLCLGGVMVWAGSLDDANGDAAAALSAANGRAALNEVALSSLQNSLTQVKMALSRLDGSVKKLNTDLVLVCLGRLWLRGRRLSAWHVSGTEE